MKSSSGVEEEDRKFEKIDERIGPFEVGESKSCLIRRWRRGKRRVEEPPQRCE